MSAARTMPTGERRAGASSVRLVLILFLAPAILLAGCVDPFGPTINCREYLSEHHGEGELVVLVALEPGGPPVEGASLTVRAWGTCWERNERAQTGPDGTASWRFPAWGVANVDVQAEGLTAERVERVALPPDNVSFMQGVPLYRQTLHWEASGAYSSRGPGVLPIVGGDSGIVQHQVTWDASPASLPEYARRIVRLDVGLAWNNSATSFADLGLAIGPAEDRVDFVFDSEADQDGTGSFREAGSLDARAMYGAGWNEASGLFVGPLSNKPHLVLQSAIPYALWIDAFFASPGSNGAPAPAAIAIFALAVGACVAARCRR